MAERAGSSVNALSVEEDTATTAYIPKVITAFADAQDPYPTVSKYEKS
ncbi:hypothetical protein ES703_56852 [subsurface metagenome]